MNAGLANASAYGLRSRFAVSPCGNFEPATTCAVTIPPYHLLVLMTHNSTALVRPGPHRRGANSAMDFTSARAVNDEPRVKSCCGRDRE